jgi:hypothetical protein
MAAATRKTTAAKADDVQQAADTGKGVSQSGEAPTGNVLATPKAGLGKVAYEAYRNAVDGGDAMDEWDDVHGKDNGGQAAAWEAAAQAVLGATFGKKEA